MKNTFKYIAALVAIFAATLASGLSVFAQNLNDGTYLVDNGIAYAKRAIINDDGTYTIDLESFVTGEVTETHEAVAADIVLVLDVSGSMDDSINSYEYRTASVNALYGYYYDNDDPTDYYYKYNEKYYPLYIGRAGRSGNRRYFLFFYANGQQLYINTSGTVVSEQPNNVNSYDTNLLASSVQLYTRVAVSGSSVSKIESLQKAVKSFISVIDENDRIDEETGPRDTRLGNRIAIVAFSGANYAGQSNHDNSIKLSTSFIELGEDHDVSNNSGVTTLNGHVDGLSTGGGTHVEYGMQDALALINSSSAENKTVVLFTDGVPGTGDWDDQESVNSANSAINYANQIKGADGTKATVWSVAIFDLNGSDKADADNYMSRVSSNYLRVQNMTSTATPVADKYYIEVDDDESLNSIFTTIAHSASSIGNTEVSGTSSVTVDIVSSSFSVPKGFEENPSSAITVLVAPCIAKTNIDGVDYLTFGEAKAPTEYGLPAISPSINESDNKVSTTGFDYSANWCGPDPTSTSTIQPGYHGFKQIIRFVITVNDDAVGGPNVDTNDSDSGIYLDGETEPLITFNRPTVKLPVQIWLQKQGLRPGDSAVFTLYMCEFSKWDPEKDIEDQAWNNFTKVVVNYEDMDNNGLVKIVGLDPDYYYRLKEDAWAFGYTYQDGGIQYTVGDNVQNPFVFVNEPKELKFDEASARNIFNEKTASSGGDEGGESGNR